MLYLSFIWHMHQPYYRDIASDQIYLPWVRLHGIKDYLDMVKILSGYPKIHQTFNFVPSLLEQIQAYINGSQDVYQKISYKKAKELTNEEKNFIKEHFFSAHLNNIISIYPRYYELYIKKSKQGEFNAQDYLDLQVLFNLSWFDPYFKKNIPELRNLIDKARDFSEEDKFIVLNKQVDILKEIIPTYKNFKNSGQIELTISPYYHPIMPLLYNTNTAKESNRSTSLPQTNFAYPEDVIAQIKQAVEFYKNTFDDEMPPCGMWPSEEAVSEHIIPIIIKAGIKWIVTDEEILFRSIKKKRSSHLLYKTYCLKRKEGDLTILFRDRNLSDLIGFVYHNMTEPASVADFIGHLHNIAKTFKHQDAYIVIAMDGENAWEYYKNDGWNFLSHLYKSISDDPLIQTVTVSEYLKLYKAKDNIKRLSAGSWIYGNFNKWIGQEQKNKAWEYLAKARKELEILKSKQTHPQGIDLEKAIKQIYICEGSDWFWWYGDNNKDFDTLFRKHLINFYKFIAKEPPHYLNHPI